MANISLKDWLALLSEAGVKFSSGSGLRTAAETAAQRWDLKLDSEDQTALARLEAQLNPGSEPQRNFLTMVVEHVPLLDDPIPSRKYPPGTGGGVKTKLLAATDPATLPALPPWGVMEEKLLAAMAEAVVPIDWTPPDGSTPVPANWQKWLDGLISGIDSLLWPVYKKGSGTWSTPKIASLFDADFQLLDYLHQYMGLPVNAMYPTKVIHNTFFAEEDDGNIAFGTGYDRYDPTLHHRVLNGLPTVFIAGMADKVGTLDLQLKQVFLRPRAYQVAFLQDRQDFGYRWARTGNTPSLVSGHCLQVSIAGCTGYIAYAQDLKTNPRSVEILKQFTVDVGDRRVFAGVHYPSDNLASWYVALNLIPLVFDGEHAAAARHFLWSAISTKSIVFAAVKAYKDSAGNSPYKPIVDEITRLGSADR